MGPAAPAYKTGTAEKKRSNDDTELVLSARGREAVAAAVDDVITFSRQAGRDEQVAMWQSRRGQPVTIADVRGLVDACDYLRGTNELRSAQRLAAQLQTIAEYVKQESPGIFALIQLKLSYLDDDFERYESALRRLDSAMEILKFDGDVPLKGQLANRAIHAYYLRKLKKHEEAERLYLQYLKDAREHPESVGKDDVQSAKFELAAMYADLGEFQKAQDVIPKESTCYTAEDGEVDPKRIFLTLTINIKYWMLDSNRALDAAAELGQTLIDQMQHYCGVGSPPYAEATEMMAKVRAEQRRYDDAIELLKKAMRIRAELFGDDHPSIARVHAEIDRIQKVSLADTPSIGLPPVRHDTGDRNGNSSSKDAQKSSVKK